jgi:hypothetical protein
VETLERRDRRGNGIVDGDQADDLAGEDDGMHCPVRLVLIVDEALIAVPRRNSVRQASG